MSRSHNERSVPQVRGRRQESNGKRLAHKRMRQMSLDVGIEALKVAGKSVTLDRETRRSGAG